MDSTQPDQRLGAIAARVNAHAAATDSALLAALVAQTFSDVDPDDLAARSADEMAGAVHAQRRAGARAGAQSHAGCRRLEQPPHRDPDRQ
jgi:hypothetical protein